MLPTCENDALNLISSVIFANVRILCETKGLDFALNVKQLTVLFCQIKKTHTFPSLLFPVHFRTCQICFGTSSWIIKRFRKRVLNHSWSFSNVSLLWIVKSIGRESRGFLHFPLDSIVFRIGIGFERTLPADFVNICPAFGRMDALTWATISAGVVWTVGQ